MKKCSVHSDGGDCLNKCFINSTILKEHDSYLINCPSELGKETNGEALKEPKLNDQCNAKEQTTTSKTQKGSWNSLFGTNIKKRLSSLLYHKPSNVEGKMLWKPKGHVEVSTDVFYFKFGVEADKQSYGVRIMAYARLRGNLKTDYFELNLLPIWVKIFDLPKEYWTSDALGDIASGVD
ncbi:hypothetical protein GIB67_024030 [Kingdonia uniflora]|uniref:DUF4283 domain-containing protein n=1 Tax=Kingdonia uniflora TaxID=39325 RepID=A0A7J7N5M6_9MAGN|nr:hypothetical protein GIB67_024030 [Kingdonia uniflora]